MFTVCPKCALTLAVTAGDLRAGQGYVRCGRCANVFNALLGLADETGLATDAKEPEAVPATTIDSATATASRPQLIEPADEVTPSSPETADDEWEAEEIRRTGTFETIVLEGDTFLQTEETIPEEAFDSELADVSRRLAAAANDEARSIDSTSGAAADEFAGELLERAPERPPTRPGWLILAAALVLVLVAQVINHWRNDLAVHAPWYGAMSRVAAVFGEPLRPNWDLAAYDVRQLGAAADGTDGRTLHVRLSLANTGKRAQSLPLLRVTLLDRFGKALSSGELEPEQYLPADLRGLQFIQRDQRIDTAVSVLDSTQQASSFELDVCLAAAGGGLRCAGDTPVIADRL